ncbi:hypothetical protein GTW51_02085 [Aurantimonas aggregata]|uniref:Uncharacterized protein n=1 Tax=Aurantimonas aggregata TaxID=2047720 RepID=A0A6L9MCT4_9HYPH|nr:apolipoprotein A1/A4/E family protein [Aurantimonas aggregata]NDV85481.1 hypothetical protein [Aurantimonas aggregata]
MGGSRFIPIVIAGLVGLLIGWWAGPDIDDVNERTSQRIAELEAPIAQIQTHVTELSQRVPADVATAGTGVADAVNALQARVDQLGADVVARTDALSQSLQQQAGQTGGNVAEAVNALQARVDQLAADLAARTDAISQAVQGQASAPAAGAGDPAALAAEIGNTGAILLPGQSAIYGGSPVVLSAISAEAGTATLAVAGGEPQDVAAGESVDVGEGCSVTLAGVAAGAAYLSAEGCGTAAPAEAATPAAAAPAAEAPAAEAPATAAAPAADAPAAEAPAPAAEAPAAEPADTGATPIGGTAIFGETRIFVSGLTENEATLFPVGGSRERVAVGGTLDAGDGCTVTVDSIANGAVTLSSEGCGADAAAAPAAEEAAPAEAAAPATAPAAAPPAAAPAEAPAPAAPAPAAPAAAPAPAPAAPAAAAVPPAAGEPTGISTGQTASFGEHRVFLSGVTDTEATIYVVGSGRQQLAAGASADVGDGCTITLDRIEAGTAYLSAAGC